MTITAVAPPAGWSQTDRADIHALVVSIVDQFILAHSPAVRKMWHTLPETLDGEGPFVYLGEIMERNVLQTLDPYDKRTTYFEGSIYYVDVIADPQETDDRVNVFSDFMRDWFSANARTLTAGLLIETGAGDAPPLHEGPYPFVQFAVHWQYQITRGRTVP